MITNVQILNNSYAIIKTVLKDYIHCARFKCCALKNGRMDEETRETKNNPYLLQNPE